MRNIIVNDINYEILPSHLRGALQRYIEQGQIPGGFLQAVIANDLSQSIGRADEASRASMFDIVSFMHNEAPAECWGSKEKMKTWSRRYGHGRFQARTDAATE